MSLYTFCENGDIEGVRAALRRGEDVNQIWRHADGISFGNNMGLPLQGAIKGNHPNIVAFLIQQPGIDMNLKTFANYMAEACFRGHTSCVVELKKWESMQNKEL